MENQERITLPELAKALAPRLAHYLGEKVKIDLHGCFVKMTGKSGKGISLRSMNNSGDRPDRVRVSGYYPGSYSQIYNSDNAPSMGFSASRLPEDIWRDIEKRFMSDYERVYDIVAKRVEASNEYERALTRKNSEVHSALTSYGYTARGDKNEVHFHSPSHEPYSPRGMVHISVGSPIDRYNLTMENLNARQFAAILKLVGKVD